MSEFDTQEGKNTSSRRTKYETWSEILEVCLYTSRSQTWILQKLGLKTSALKEALQFLLERELLDKEQKAEIILYKTSSKGEEALILFYKLITSYFSSKSKRKILHWSVYED